ncbi:hypothetical protein [Roseixanthobacter pseudopolyaromaticivorans]|uniref:hypothetical protein n=1 Tax=Xanthobacteraceae TaxID=335928 RepID=UPI00372A7727
MPHRPDIRVPKNRSGAHARRIVVLTTLVYSFLGLATGAFAQVGSDPRPPDAPGPTLPAPRSDENLSKRLDRTEGVIPPPRNVDPELTHPAPDVGTTPIIPPPGSPGGNPQVQPK